MRFRALFLGLVATLSMSTLTSAQDDSFPTAIRSSEYPIEGSEKLYLRDLFAITECMVENDIDDVRRLMSQQNGASFQAFLFGQIAKRNGDCLTRGTQMRSNAEAFRGGLASALLQRKYAKATMPDYSDMPQVFGQRNPDDLPLDERITELYLLIGECVFRRDPEGALSFLKTDLFSTEASDVYNELAPAFVACAPEGVVENVESERMRGLLAQAAYYVDLNHEMNEAGAG